MALRNHKERGQRKRHWYGKAEGEGGVRGICPAGRWKKVCHRSDANPMRREGQSKRYVTASIPTIYCKLLTALKLQFYDYLAIGGYDTLTTRLGPDAYAKRTEGHLA
jgi:hypothetical protein